MVKWDGHTHTEFCPHGSQDRTVDRIEKAIKLGFTCYSITEHAPLPVECLSDPQLRKDCGMTLDKTKEYFLFIRELKRIYGAKIILHQNFIFVQHYHLKIMSVISYVKINQIC